MPVIENAEKNTVVTKTLVLPKSDDGSQQTQTITYKDKTFLSLTIQQKRPVSDELKTYIDQHGVEETQKALLEAEEKDQSIIEARKLAGFKLETKLLSATELQTTTSYEEGVRMGFTEETVRFKLDDSNKKEISETLTDVYASLNDKGYNPINQIVGYVLSGDPAYVPRYNNARNQIRKYERDEIVEELVRYYLKGQGVDL